MSPKKISVGFIITGLAIIFLIWVINYRSSPSGPQPISQIEEGIAVTDEGSETFYIPSDRRLKMRWLSGYNSSFIKHYNGGKNVVGGWDEVVPPYNDWRSLGYVPKEYGNILTSVKFSLVSNPDGEDVVVQCRLVPKE